MALGGWVLLWLNTFALLAGAPPQSLWAIPALILAPSVSALAELALSRHREFDADLGAVELTGQPEALASALLRIEAAEQRAARSLVARVMLQSGRVLTGPLALPRIPAWLRTHPETAERVERLMELSRRGPSARARRRPSVTGPVGDSWRVVEVRGPRRVSFSAR